jgi:hypothetical protein
MNEKKLDIVINTAKIRLIEWMDKKPSGVFIIQITVNQGGIRGQPKITITEEMNGYR